MKKIVYHIGIDLGAITFFAWMITACVGGIEFAFNRAIPVYVAYFGSIPNTQASFFLGVLGIVGATTAIVGHAVKSETAQRIGLLMVGSHFIFDALGRTLWLALNAIGGTVPQPPATTGIQPLTLFAYACLYWAAGLGIFYMVTRPSDTFTSMSGRG